MFSQLFGIYLVEQNVITKDVMNELVEAQVSARPKLGTIAVAEGYLSESEAEEINHIQTQQDKRFGDIALDKGFLTKEQLDDVVSQQGNPFMKFLQILTEKKCMPVTDIDRHLTDFQKSRGFSDEEMKALKKEDIDEIVPLFAYASKPYVTELTALVLRNITRFITSDFYIGRIKHIDNYKYHYIVGQKIAGDHDIYIAFSATEEEKGLLTLGKAYAREEYDSLNNHVFDSVGEFTNICSGLLATQLSEKDVEIDMEVPFTYSEQSVSGTGYVIPIYLNGYHLDLFIAIDEEGIVIGKNPVDTTVEKKAGSKVTEDSRGTVLIVDDSALTRRTLRDLVEDEGYTVIGEAVNGAEGVEEYKKFQPDLVTLDITMPIMDGVEALKNIMEFDPEAKAVMITAAGQQQTVIKAIKIGASRFIMKPFKREEVVNMLNEIIK